MALALARTLADELSRLAEASQAEDLRVARALAHNVVDLVESAQGQRR